MSGRCCGCCRTQEGCNRTVVKGEPGKRSYLNGDGKVDHLDDYIITTNYLIIRQKAVPKIPMQFKPPPPASVPGAGVKSVQ
jgi:hypothetical protein